MAQVTDTQSIYADWSLEQLAEEANEAATTAERQQKASLQNAIQAGHMLIAAKSKCEHGTWTDWLKKNWSHSQRRAQQFMKLAVAGVEVDLFGNLKEALRETEQPKAHPGALLPPLPDDTTPQPSIAQPSAATRQRKDIGRAGDEMQQPAESIAPDPAPQRLKPTREMIEDFLNTLSLTDLCEAIRTIDGDDRAKAKELLQLAYELDPALRPKPAKATGVPPADKLIEAIPDTFSDRLRAAAADWAEYKQELLGKDRIRSYKAWQVALRKMQKLPESVVCDAIEKAIANGWKGWLQDSTETAPAASGRVHTSNRKPLQYEEVN